MIHDSYIFNLCSLPKLVRTSKLRKAKDNTFGRSWPTGIISEKNVKKYRARMWTGFFWLRTVANEEPY
jgi:hypothetical protein